MTPTVSVVIPTLNEQENIATLITNLFTQSYKHIEVVVVDGGSSDKTVSIIKRFKKVKLIKSRPGVARQRNVGAINTVGLYLLFLDADVRLDIDFVEKFISKFKKQKLSIACPKFVPYDSTLVINIFYWIFNKIFKISENKLPSGASTGLLLKKDVYLKHGGFKENVVYEDIELIRRIGKKEKYATVDCPLYVSDRRFREYGVFKTILKYIILSLFFIVGAFNAANRIKYPMGKYDKK